MNQVSKIIIIIKKMIKSKKGGDEQEGESVEERDIFIFIFLLFASFSNLRKSDRRFSSGLKAKLIHTTRATRGYQNLGVLSNSTR